MAGIGNDGAVCFDFSLFRFLARRPLHVGFGDSARVVPPISLKYHLLTDEEKKVPSRGREPIKSKKRN